MLKRELYKIPIERVEDPALQRLFQEKQEELELKLTMLRDRDTPRFLYESLQLFGGVRDDLLQLATGPAESVVGQGSRRQEPQGHMRMALPNVPRRSLSSIGRRVPNSKPKHK